MAVNLVNVEQVSKVYGTRALLDGVSLGVSEGDRIGVVGRNGDGKTTLIRMLAKLEEADTGRVTHNGGLRLGVLTQHDSLDPKATIRHEVIGDLADHEWAGSAKIRDVLTGLFGGLDLAGFEQGLDTVIAPLSGGERRMDRAGQAPDRRAGPDRPRRADQPPRRRGHLLAGRASARPPLGTGLRHPRPVVPRPGLHPHVGRPARHGPRVRGRLQRLRLRPGRTRADRRDRGGQAAEPDAQGAGLAAARRPRPYVQAALPHRGRQRTDRRCAAAARHQRADEVRQRPARQDRLRAGGRHRPGQAPRRC